MDKGVWLPATVDAFLSWRGEKSTVLVVDHSDDDVAWISSLLKESYRTKIAMSGEKALRIAFSDAPPDLVLLGIEMPGMSGYEVCRRLKAEARSADIPVIFLGLGIGDEEAGFRVGAVDHIAKPVSPPILHSRVDTHLTLARARRLLLDEKAALEADARRRTEEISLAQDITILGMAMLVEIRDCETGAHILRTKRYMRELATVLKGNPRFPELDDGSWVELLIKSVPMHDIGKVGIPDNILHKPGRLSPEEFEVMKTHTTLGRDAIVSAERLLGASSSFLFLAREVATSHHEKWNGEGYPEGLSGDDIPLSARLMAVADVYDALVAPRVYKPALAHDKAVAMIRAGIGRDFDPDVIGGFLEVADRFAGIAMEFADALTGRILCSKAN